MQFAEYKALDPETRRATWAAMSGDEQAALKAEALQGAAAGQQAAPAAEPVASEAISLVTQSLGASVGRHLRQAITKAAASTGMTPDEIATRLMQGEDLGDLGIEETSTLKAAVNKLRGGRRTAAAADAQAQMQAAQEAQAQAMQAMQAMPQQAPQQPQMAPQGQPQMPQEQPQPADLLSLMGGM